MTWIEQLEELVKGNPIHNEEIDECCPDFSCCSSGDISPEEERRRFAQAYYDDDHTTVYRMLAKFLSKLLREQANVEVIGTEKL